jgi:hypothetical protein
MLSKLYDAFRRKIGADEPPAKASAEAVVIEDARFRSIDGKFDALNHTMDQRFDAVSQRVDALNQPIDGLSRVMDQGFGAFGQGINQRFGSASRCRQSPSSLSTDPAAISIPRPETAVTKY